jgi:hypothetical protein
MLVVIKLRRTKRRHHTATKSWGLYGASDPKPLSLEAWSGSTRSVKSWTRRRTLVKRMLSKDEREQPTQSVSLITKMESLTGYTEDNPDCSWMLLRNALTIAAGASFTSNKTHYLQDLDPPDPAEWQWDMVVDQKGGEPTTRLWLKSVSNHMWWETGVFSRRYSFKLDRKFDSSLLQKAIFIATPQGMARKTEIQVSEWSESEQQ